MSNGISRRKFLGAVAATGVATGVGGAGTYAYITDNSTAEISFQAGSIVLKISPKTIDFTSDTVDSGEDNEQDDGDEMKTTVTVTNAGTLPVGQLQLDGMSLTGPEDLKKAAEITTVEVNYGGSTSDETSTWDGIIAGAGWDEDGDGKSDLIDLNAKLNGGEVISLLSSGQTLNPLEDNSLELTLGITYDYSQVTTNGGTLEADFEWTAEQVN